MKTSEIQELVQQFVDAFRKRMKVKRDLTFLLVGRTGVGKSSTINTLLGSEVAKVGKYRPTTVEVKKYSHNHDGVNFVVVDTPGLCDDLPEAGKDQQYLELMKSQVQEIDSYWYVAPLADTRLTADDRRGIKLVSQAFGPKVWDHCVIVFTFADKLDQAEYLEALKERTALVREEIAKYAPASASAVPSVAVSNTKATTPDGKPWLGELFTVVLTRCSDAGMVPLLVSMTEDLHPTKKPAGGKPRIELTPAQKKRVSDNLITRIFQGATAGAKIGKSYGWLGAAVGAVLGGAVGGLFSWLLEG